MGLAISVATFMEHYLRHGICPWTTWGLPTPDIIINGTLFTLKYIPGGVLSCVVPLVKGDLHESSKVA